VTTTLKFNAKAHRYHLDGRPIPGVTTLLGKGLPKPAIPYWAAKTVAEYVVDNPEQVENLRSLGRGPAVAALKAIPWQARDEAAVRGTAVHELADRVIRGEEVDVPEHLLGYVEGYVRWLDEFHVEPVLSEFRVANRKWWYAGTGDLVVRIGADVLLLDIKTSRAVYGSTALQCAAYRGAEFYDADGEELPLPETTGIGVVHVTETGTRLHRFRDAEAAWKDWLHVQWVANSVPRIDEQLLEADEAPADEAVA
jgi:hypothetical protein